MEVDQPTQRAVALAQDLVEEARLGVAQPTQLDLIAVVVDRLVDQEGASRHTPQLRTVVAVDDLDFRMEEGASRLSQLVPTVASADQGPVALQMEDQGEVFDPTPLGHTAAAVVLEMEAGGWRTALSPGATTI